MTPIVFVPGLLCSAEVFAPQIMALWPYGPITIAAPLVGNSIPEFAADILASAPPRFALVGISMGGQISLEIMRQAPQRVMRLALLDTSARPDTPEQSAMRRTMIGLAQGGRFFEMTEQLGRLILHPAHQDDMMLRDIIARMCRTVGAEAFVRQQEALIARPDPRAGIEAISVPTVVLVGDRDALTVPESVAELAAGIPGARLVVIPECGHGSTLEQPEAVNQVLIGWIKG